MRQMVGTDLGDDPTVADLLLSVSPAAGARGGRRGRALRAGADGDRRREDPDALRRGAGGVRRRRRLRPRGGLGRLHRARARRALRPREVPRAVAPCPAASRSGWCWSTCWPVPTRCCCSTSRTTSSTSRARSGSSSGSASPTRRSCSSATTASCSNNTATRIVTVELGASAAATWCGPTRAGSRRTTRRGATGSRASRSMRRRWDEEHAKIKALVLRLKIKAEYNDGMASQYKAAQTRLRKFEEAGPPTEQPREQQVTMRLKGGRTGKRAVVCEDLELTGLMQPFDLEVWYGERVAVLGSNGSGKSHFLRLLAAGGSDPDVEHRPVDAMTIEPVRHTGKAKLGARVRPGLVRADPRAPRAARPHAAGDPAPRRRHARRSRRDGPRGGGPGARPLRARPRLGAEVRVALRWSAGPVPDPAARAVGRDAAAARRADRQPRRPVGRGARGRGWRPSRARSSRSPTTAGSPAASTGSWSTARTARSTSPTVRSGTRRGCAAPADAGALAEHARDAVGTWGSRGHVRVARRGCGARGRHRRFGRHPTGPDDQELVVSSVGVEGDGTVVGASRRARR